MQGSNICLYVCKWKLLWSHPSKGQYGGIGTSISLMKICLLQIHIENVIFLQTYVTLCHCRLFTVYTQNLLWSHIFLVELACSSVRFIWNFLLWILYKEYGLLNCLDTLYQWILDQKWEMKILYNHYFLYMLGQWVWIVG